MAWNNPELGEFVENVRQQTDILDVVRQYVPLSRKGGRYWGCCPFHHEKTPSFSVVPEKGFFYCFGCHAGGDVFKFISQIENVTYFEAVKLQAERVGIPLPARRQKTSQEIARDKEMESLRQVNELAQKFFYNCLTKTSYGQTGLQYFAGRDISRETIDEFRLGFAPDAWDKLSVAFQKRGVPPELLLKAGLSGTRQSGGLYDRLRNRVIIPIADENGRVVGFGGRRIVDDATAEKIPKYWNTPETILFNKRRILFGLDRSRQAIRAKGYAIVVEGYMDAISVFSAGIHNVVASLGTAFTIDHCKKLMRYAKKIYFCYDSDEAGQKATMRALSIVEQSGAEVRVLIVPDGKDPDEFVRKHGPEAFEALVERALPLWEYCLQYVLKHIRHDTPEGKMQVLRALLPLLKSTSDKTVQTSHIRQLASLLLLDEGDIRSELAGFARKGASYPEDRAGNDFVVPAGRSAPVRSASGQRRRVREKQNAQSTAARVLIGLTWQNPPLLLHAETIVPRPNLAATAAQDEVFAYIEACAEAGEEPDETEALAQLSEAAGEELSRAIVSAADGEDADEDITQVYTVNLRFLHIAYLSSQYQQHSQASQQLGQAGDTAGALRELKLAQDLLARRTKLEQEQRQAEGRKV